MTILIGVDYGAMDCEVVERLSGIKEFSIYYGTYEHIDGEEYAVYCSAYRAYAIKKTGGDQMTLKRKFDLIEVNDRYHRIMGSTDSDYQKQLDLERLQTDMEVVFNIPPLTDERYKKNNPEVMSMYRRVKRQRVFI